MFLAGPCKKALFQQPAELIAYSSALPRSSAGGSHA